MARAWVQRQRWAAHRAMQDLGAPRPRPGSHIDPGKRCANPRCTDNPRAKRCDHRLCGKCCRKQQKGIWCTYHGWSHG